MENGWSLFSDISDSGSGAAAISIGRGQNGHSTNNVAWDIWDGVNTPTTTCSRYDWCNHTSSSPSFHPISAASAEASAFHALLFNPPDHLMCLKLGKRHYFEDPNYAGDGDALQKRGKQYYGLPPAVTVASVAPPPVVVPKCQVEGCHVALLHAKEYHRRHKVCEMHSKAPRVMVFGQEQRFCQQCSRFHGVGEFDESKRSCRRRLAGHNERRRKGSTSINGGSIASISLSKNTPRGRALSLLSSNNDNGPWISSADLSLRCSAALRELIAENRAAIFGRPMWNNVHNTTLLDSGNTETYKNDDHHHHQQQHQSPVSSCHHNQQQMLHDNSHVWDRFHMAADTTMTLNLRQAPNSAFGFLSVRGKSKETEDCPDFWTTLGDTHVV